MGYLKSNRIKLLIGLVTLFLLFQAYKFIKVRIDNLDLPKGKIVFSANIDGDDEIYIMNINGTNIKQLTKNSSKKTNLFSDIEPSFSPDGKMIVFKSSRLGDSNYRTFMDKRGRIIGEGFSGGSADVFIMDSEGRYQIPLTYQDLIYCPFFSPDAENVIFTTIKGARPQAGSINIYSKNRRILNINPGHCVFSPDGTKIFDTFDNDISVMDKDGSNRIKLTSFFTLEDNRNAKRRMKLIYNIIFSNDRKKIAFILKEDKIDRYRKFYDLTKFFTMDIDSSNLNEIYKIDGSQLNELFEDNYNEKERFCDIKRFMFSPDNKFIIFIADFIWKKGIYSLNLQSGVIKELTLKKKIWSDILDFNFIPDGKRIIFVADIYPKFYVFHALILRTIRAYINFYLFKRSTPFYDNKYLCIMDIDGKNYRRITKLPNGTELGRDFIHWEK